MEKNNIDIRLASTINIKRMVSTEITHTTDLLNVMYSENKLAAHEIVYLKQTLAHLRASMRALDEARECMYETHDSIEARSK